MPTKFDNIFLVCYRLNFGSSTSELKMKALKNVLLQKPRMYYWVIWDIWDYVEKHSRYFKKNSNRKILVDGILTLNTNAIRFLRREHMTAF